MIYTSRLELIALQTSLGSNFPPPRARAIKLGNYPLTTEHSTGYLGSLGDYTEPQTCDYAGLNCVHYAHVIANTARELVVLSVFFTSHSTSVKRLHHLRGHASHERYTVSKVEGREINLHIQASPEHDGD